MIAAALNKLALPWVGGPLIAVLVLLTVWCGVQQVRLSGAHAALAAEQRDHQATKTQYALAREQAVVDARAWEDSLRRQVDQARKDADVAQQQISQQARTIAALNADLARLRIDADGVRQQLADARRARGADVALGACLDYGRALEEHLASGAQLLREGQELVGEGAQLAAELADARDRFAIQVTACVNAYREPGK